MEAGWIDGLVYRWVSRWVGMGLASRWIGV